MVPNTITLASRSSPLAIAQTHEAIAHLRAFFPEHAFETITATSPGDRDLVTSLTDPSGPDDFFTRDIDQLLLEGKAHIGVHSAKDLPQQLTTGLTVAALLPARDIRDALVVRQGLTTDEDIVRIGTSSPKREEQIKNLYPHARACPIRGTIQQRLDQLDAGDYDALIVAACALERLGLAERIHRYLPYDPAPQQGRLALVTREDQRSLIDALRQLDVRARAGLVAIVGCPAEAALLSTRARSYLDQADIVIHDRLLPDEILLTIRNKAVPVGKSGGGTSTPQVDIHRQLLHAAEAGKLVVRLQGGDPLIFAHLSEELAFLHDWNIRVDLVPTLTAAQVAAAHALAPLTHRGDGGHVHFLTGHTPPGEPPLTFPGPGEGNLAIYMGVAGAGQIQTQLNKSGWPPDTAVLIGERLGYRDEAVRTVALSDLADTPIEKPAIFLVGPRPHPLAERTLFVGTDPEHFLNHGPLIHWPLIKLISKPLPERAQHLRDLLDSVDGIIFPSRFAVHSFVEALLSFADVRLLKDKRLLSVGPATAAELNTYGLRADASIDSYRGVAHLIQSLTADDQGRYLYPCSDQAPAPERVAVFSRAGIEAIPAVFYENRLIAYNSLPATPFSRVLFTSTSTVHAYFELYPSERNATRQWLAVGPSTLRALEALGLRGWLINKP